MVILMVSNAMKNYLNVTRSMSDVSTDLLVFQMPLILGRRDLVRLEVGVAQLVGVEAVLQPSQE